MQWEELGFHVGKQGQGTHLQIHMAALFRHQKKILKHPLENNQLFPRYLVMVHTSTSKNNKIIIPINICIKYHSTL